MCYDENNREKDFHSIVTAVNISPAVIRLNSQSLTSAGNVLLQRGAADHPTVAARLLELWRSFWYALAQVHLMKLQDACGEKGGGERTWEGCNFRWSVSLITKKKNKWNDFPRLFYSYACITRSLREGILDRFSWKLRGRPRALVHLWSKMNKTNNVQ